MPGRIRNTDFSLPLRIQKIIETLRHLIGLYHLGVIEDADRQHAPRRDEAGLFLEFCRELFRGRGKKLLKQSFLSHDQLHAPVSFYTVETRFPRSPFSLRAV